jgi:hypothetical protein
MRRLLAGVGITGMFIVLLLGIASTSGAESSQRAACEIRAGKPKLVDGEIVSRAFIRANRACANIVEELGNDPVWLRLRLKDWRSKRSGFIAENVCEFGQIDPAGGTYKCVLTADPICDGKKHRYWLRAAGMPGGLGFSGRSVPIKC